MRGWNDTLSARRPKALRGKTLAKLDGRLRSLHESVIGLGLPLRETPGQHPPNKHYSITDVVRAGLRGAAEFGAVLGVAGFVLSGLMNSIVFYTWKLSFFQIADSGDVLMSGVELALQLILFGVSWTAMFVVGMIVYYTLPRAQKWIIGGFIYKRS